MSTLRFFIAGGLIFSLAAFCFPSPEATWMIDFQKAQHKAVEEEKPILMVFSGSDWCKPCILLEKEVFDTDTFRDFAASKLVLLKLDFPRKRKNAIPKSIQKQHEALAEKYNPEGSFPLVLLVNAEGKVLKNITYTQVEVSSFIQEITAP